MKKDVIISNLVGFGYTATEARIYLTALECGTAPASQIAEHLNLNRVTTYGTCQKLVKKGLLYNSKIKDTKHFTAIEPELFFEEQRQKINILASSIPFLKELSTQHTIRPKVQLFEGIDELKKAYKKTLSAKTEILNYANSRNIRDHWPNYDKEYVRQRAKRKIFLRGIAPDDHAGRMVQKSDKDFYRETRLFPKDLFRVENEINIFDDKILIASFEPRSFVILIQSSTVAETQRQIFNLAWHQ